MKLTSRLLEIANLVDTGSSIADIGTDHGYIPAYLMKNKKIKFAILSDVNKGPLENAKKEFTLQNINENIEFRLGSGFEVLEINEVEIAIVAGMGGILISEIIEAHQDIAKSFKKIIFQPMQAPEKLRKYLFENGYNIISEKLVKEDFRIYEIIVANYVGKNKINHIDLFETNNIYFEVSPSLINSKDPLLNDFLDKKIESYKKIETKLMQKINNSTKNKKIEIQKKIEKLIELKNNI